MEARIPSLLVVLRTDKTGMQLRHGEIEPLMGIDHKAE